MRTIKESLKTIIIALVVLAGVNFVYAWVEPSLPPPDGNVAMSSGMPSGAVMYFNLVSCPSGWSELISAQGRYIVGIPSGGALSSVVGTALSNLEDRVVGKHTHGITDPGHKHFHSYLSGTGPNGDIQFSPSNTNKPYYTGTAVTGITINDAGSVDGTNAPYIQFLVCQKD